MEKSGVPIPADWYRVPVSVGTDHITDLPGLGLPKPKTVVTGWHTQLHGIITASSEF